MTEASSEKEINNEKVFFLLAGARRKTNSHHLNSRFAQRWGKNRQQMAEEQKLDDEKCIGWGGKREQNVCLAS